MEEKKIFQTLKRLLPGIIVISLLVSLFIHFSLKKNCTYTASAVINYSYDAAEQGKTPINTDLDVNEIKSSAIISKVIDQLSLSDRYSVDKLISRITITACPDADKEEQKAAKLKEGEEYVYVPTTYIVAFTATNSEGESFAQTMLDELLDTYFSVFGENYINVDHISNKIEKIYENQYDYLEMVEYIDTCIAYLERLRSDIIVERFVSQSPADMLIAPKWGIKNHEFTNRLVNRMKELDTWQGAFKSKKVKK